MQEPYEYGEATVREPQDMLDPQSLLEVVVEPARRGRPHIGRPRTTTVVLAVLWVGLLALYIMVHP